MNTCRLIHFWENGQQAAVLLYMEIYYGLASWQRPMGMHSTPYYWHLKLGASTFPLIGMPDSMDKDNKDFCIAWSKPSAMVYEDLDQHSKKVKEAYNGQRNLPLLERGNNLKEETTPTTLLQRS